VSVQVAIARNANNLVEDARSVPGWGEHNEGGRTATDGQVHWIGHGNFEGGNALGKLAYVQGHEFLHGRNGADPLKDGTGVGHFSYPNHDQILQIEGIPDVR
jgi:hypothetical protein